MSIKERLLDVIHGTIDSIDIDQMFENLQVNSTIQHTSLLALVECLYYKRLIAERKQDDALLSYLKLLNEENAKISLLTYSYIIYHCERIKNKKTSIDDFNMYI